MICNCLGGTNCCVYRGGRAELVDQNRAFTVDLEAAYARIKELEMALKQIARGRLEAEEAAWLARQQFDELRDSS